MNKFSSAKLAIAVFATMLPLSVFGAEFTYFKDPSSGLRMLGLRGPIEAGDTKKLLRMISADEVSQLSFLSIGGMDLDSPGGSVDEAIKLGQFLEASGTTVKVSAGRTCASACFLLFVSSTVRFGPGDVIVHRPYFDIKGLSADKHSAYSKGYQDSILAMRQYLFARSVPSDLIDKMMELPSTDGYVLTVYDKQRIGSMSPALEEYAIQNCGITSVDMSSSIQIEPAKMSCLISYGSHIKLSFMAKTFGSSPMLDRISADLKARDQKAGVP